MKHDEVAPFSLVLTVLKVSLMDDDALPYREMKEAVSLKVSSLVIQQFLSL